MRFVRDWPEDVGKAVIDPATADEGVRLAELTNEIAGALPES
jgi:hypothetical protein